MLSRPCPIVPCWTRTHFRLNKGPYSCCAPSKFEHWILKTHGERAVQTLQMGRLRRQPARCSTGWPRWEQSARWEPHTPHPPQVIASPPHTTGRIRRHQQVPLSRCSLRDVRTWPMLTSPTPPVRAALALSALRSLTPKEGTQRPLVLPLLGELRAQRRCCSDFQAEWCRDGGARDDFLMCCRWGEGVPGEPSEGGKRHPRNPNPASEWPWEHVFIVHQLTRCIVMPVCVSLLGRSRRTTLAPSALTCGSTEGLRASRVARCTSCSSSSTAFLNATSKELLHCAASPPSRVAPARQLGDDADDVCCSLAHQSASTRLQRSAMHTVSVHVLHAFSDPCCLVPSGASAASGISLPMLLRPVSGS